MIYVLLMFIAMTDGSQAIERREFETFQECKIERDMWLRYQTKVRKVAAEAYCVGGTR